MGPGILEVLFEYWPIFLKGLVGTLKYAFIAVSLGSILGALIALLCAVAGGPVWLQVVLFLAGSALLLLLTRPMAVKMMYKGTVRTNADSLIGKEAVVTEKIDNLHSTGTVQVNGQEWTARSVNPEHVIEKEEIVMVRSIEGVKLIVGKRIDSAEAPEE